MKATPEHQSYENAKPVYVVNQLSFIDVVMAVAIGVAIGTFAVSSIIAALGARLLS